jgi:competence protein ComEA
VTFLRALAGQSEVVEMPSVSRPRAVAYLVVVLALLALGGRFLVGAFQPAAAAEAPELALDATSVEDEPAPALVVHVAGAVRHPGLYELAEGSRIDDAIRKAGGAKPGADLGLVNLAAPVADGQQVLVPGRAGPGASPGDGTVPAAPTGPVHLNTATLEQLDELPGVGPITAGKILAYRDEHGAFQSVDELDAVPGIGPARLEELRELVAL